MKRHVVWPVVVLLSLGLIISCGGGGGGGDGGGNGEPGGSSLVGTWMKIESENPCESTWEESHTGESMTFYSDGTWEGKLCTSEYWFQDGWHCEFPLDYIGGTWRYSGDTLYLTDGSTQVEVSGQCSISGDTMILYDSETWPCSGGDLGADVKYERYSTVGSPPIVSTEAATAVGASSATFNGNVNPGGLNSDAWFEWGIDSSLTISNTTPIKAAGSGSISLTVTHDQTGLNSATTYYYRISASNVAGVTDGDIQSFATSIPLPSVTTGSVTYAGMYVAMVEGMVNPNGFYSNAWFEAGTDPNLSTFVTSTPIAVGVGTEYVSINQTLTNLSSDSTYYYRSAASNSGGTGVGDILNFSTLSSVVGTYWSKTFGGADHDSVNIMVSAADGGYFVVGNSYSTAHNCWAIKLTGSGDIQWQKAYSAGNPYSAQQTADGGFIIAGQKGIGQSSVMDVLKLDSSGNVSWYKLYGGGFEGARSVQQTSDGGYIVAGFTWTYAASFNDMWVLKLSNDGTVEWEKSYNLITTYNVANSIQQTSDGGYIVAGQLQYTFGNAQVWVLKLTADGSVDWQKIYGTFSSEYAKKILQTVDGGYVVLVYNAQDTNDRIWVLKLDSSGNIDWQKGYGGAGVGSITLTADAGFILAGSKKLEGTFNYDAMAAKLSSNGDVEWQKAYGGPGSDGATSVEQIHDGGFALAGYTETFGAGGRDFWVLRLKDDGSVPPFGYDATVTPTILNMSASNSSSTGVSSQATGQSSSVSSTNTNATVQNQAP